ncbi:hypothetical protein EON63_01235 [archaeon]|nr:MAG: hypothetical protein EON63_01235 [archaeon]
MTQQEWDWKSLDLSSPSISATNFTSHVCCRPIEKYNYENDWRNSLVDKHLQSNKYTSTASKIKLLPLASLTRPLHDLHTCNPYFKHDCTHYCYTPLLWQVFWHQIEQLMQEVHEKEEAMKNKG